MLCLVPRSPAKISVKDLCERLRETPLSNDQVLVVGAGGCIALTATVASTRSLVWWLLGFGDGVVVQEPVELREEIKATVARMAVAYA